MLEGPCACCAARRAGETAVDHPTSSVKGPRRQLPLAVPSAWTRTCSSCPGLRPTCGPAQWSRGAAGSRVCGGAPWAMWAQPAGPGHPSPGSCCGPSTRPPGSSSPAPRYLKHRSQDSSPAGLVTAGALFPLSPRWERHLLRNVTFAQPLVLKCELPRLIPCPSALLCPQHWSPLRYGVAGLPVSFSSVFPMRKRFRWSGLYLSTACYPARHLTRPR